MSPDSKFNADGFLIYDDGLSTDAMMSTEIHFSVTGDSKGNFVINFHITRDKAPPVEVGDESRNLGNVIILNALKNGFSQEVNHVAKVVLINGKEVNQNHSFLEVANNRITFLFSDPVKLTDVEKIVITTI